MWGLDQMTNFIRLTSLAATVAALAITATPASAAAPSNSATPTKQATATVHVVKPLSITWKRDLNLGNIVLGTGTWTGETVKLGYDGTFTCTAADLTCSGTHATAQYTVTGTASQDVFVNAADVSMTSGSNTLVLAVDKPATVTLNNAGSQVLNLGGTVTLNNDTPDGTYTGDFLVTVNY
jgi:Domain of unknown function (DUF4402)